MGTPRIDSLANLHITAADKQTLLFSFTSKAEYAAGLCVKFTLRSFTHDAQKWQRCHQQNTTQDAGRQLSANLIYTSP